MNTSKRMTNRVSDGDRPARSARERSNRGVVNSQSMYPIYRNARVSRVKVRKYNSNEKGVRQVRRR